MFDKAYMNFQLDLTISSDSEIYKILKPLTPVQRRDFLFSAILFYNHSPSFYQLQTFQMEMDKYLQKILEVTKHFNIQDESKEENGFPPSSSSFEKRTMVEFNNPPSSPSTSSVVAEVPFLPPSEETSQASEGTFLPPPSKNSKVFQDLSKLKNKFLI